MARGFVADARPHDVYNLTVDGAHEFFANGVLVHNCDALRYLTVNLGGGPEFTILDTPEPNPVAEAVEPLVPLAQFAYRPYADDPDWLGEDRDPAAYTVRTVS